MKRYLVMTTMVAVLTLSLVVGAKAHDEYAFPEQGNTDAPQPVESLMAEGLVTPVVTAEEQSQDEGVIASEEQAQAEVPAAAPSAQYGIEE